MGRTDSEHAREDFEPYPHGPNPPGEPGPREPTNAELHASSQSGFWAGHPQPQQPNWAALATVVAFLVIFLVVTFTLFPLDTWEFRFGP